MDLDGVGGIGGAGALSFSTLFRLHDHVIQLVTSVKMLGCCSIHLSDCFCGNICLQHADLNSLWNMFF